MNLPPDQLVTTNLLRRCYDQRDFSFGNPQAPQTVVLVGSCRIVPFLNFFRAYNDLNRHPLELLCFNPVEMWGGPGHDVAESVNRVLAGYRFGKVDYLISEHLQHCGVLNTVAAAEQNLFKDMGCEPVVHIRLPNWNAMHNYDAETAMFDADYAALPHDERVAVLRDRTAVNKARFLRHCRNSSFPELEPWIEDLWQTTRLGWTNNHPTLVLVRKLLGLTARAMGITFGPELGAHPLCASDTYAATGTPLNRVDYEANNWKF